jgi:hypothetical protein
MVSQIKRGLGDDISCAAICHVWAISGIILTRGRGEMILKQIFLPYKCLNMIASLLGIMTLRTYIPPQSRARMYLSFSVTGTWFHVPRDEHQNLQLLGEIFMWRMVSCNTDSYTLNVELYTLNAESLGGFLHAECWITRWISTFLHTDCRITRWIPTRWMRNYTHWILNR